MHLELEVKLHDDVDLIRFCLYIDCSTCRAWERKKTPVTASAVLWEGAAKEALTISFLLITDG